MKRTKRRAHTERVVQPKRIMVRYLSHCLHCEMRVKPGREADWFPGIGFTHMVCTKKLDPAKVLVRNTPNAYATKKLEEAGFYEPVERKDKPLICMCGDSFTWTVESQEFYALKGYKNLPKSCKPCRDRRRTKREEDATSPDWSKTCMNCGMPPIVPTSGMCGPCTFGEAETVNGNW